ncbi:hypothetical protein II906_05545 [bacterium]|nr:hypothetical protein [bacterium]
MLNILNTTNTNYDNAIGAKKLKSSKKINIEAPQSLYKYSLNDELKKIENMRKMSAYEIHQRDEKGKNSKKFMAFSAIAAALIFGIIKTAKEK